MSAGIAAAMVRADCKFRSIITQVDPDEAIAFVAPFSSKFLQTLDAFGIDFVDSIALVHRFVTQ